MEKCGGFYGSGGAFMGDIYSAPRRGNGNSMEGGGRGLSSGDGVGGTCIECWGFDTSGVGALLCGGSLWDDSCVECCDDGLFGEQTSSKRLSSM